MATRQYILSYKIVFWLLFIITTSVSIIDRFTLNLWPRQWFATENHETGTDRFDYLGGPWTIVAYDLIARVSGRYTMAGLNALFITMMHTTHHYLSTTWIGINLINFKDDVARMQIHICIGISICVLTIVHVWSILFPLMFSGWSIVVKIGYLTWPLSEQSPPDFVDVDFDAKIIMMEVDDCYRLTIMTVLLGPLVYLSYRWMCSNYRLGIRLHQFVLMMYFLDIIRRQTHPHTWVFNVPVFFAWVLDCIIGHFYSSQNTTVKKLIISPDYMLILWKSTHISKTFVSSIGDVFLMRKERKSVCNCGIPPCCQWERGHPFTSFNKRGAELSSSMESLIPYSTKLKHNVGNKHLVLMPNEQIRGSDNVNWDRGVVLKSYNGLHSHTKLMKDTKNLHMDIWGGFHSGIIGDLINDGEDVILIGGGSGSGYLIDTLFYLCEQAVQQNKEQVVESNRSAVGIIFTTNDLYLVKWWINIIDNILSNNRQPLSKYLSITISLTTGHGATHGVESLTPHDISWGKITLGRCKIEDEIKTMTQHSKKIAHVFCQGGEAIQNASRKAAKHTGKRYHEGHSFDNGQKGKTKKCGCIPTKILPV